MNVTVTIIIVIRQLSQIKLNMLTVRMSHSCRLCLSIVLLGRELQMKEDHVTLTQLLLELSLAVAV